MKFRRHNHAKAPTNTDLSAAIAKQDLDAAYPLLSAALPRFEAAEARDAYDAFLEAFCTAARVRYTSFALAAALRESARFAFGGSIEAAIRSSIYDGPDINESTEHFYRAHCNAVTAAHVSTWSPRTDALIDAFNNFEVAAQDATDITYIASLAAVDAADPYNPDTYAVYIVALDTTMEAQSLALCAIYDALIDDLASGKPHLA